MQIDGAILGSYQGQTKVHLPRLCEWTRGSEKQLRRTFKTHHCLHVHSVNLFQPKMPMLGGTIRWVEGWHQPLLQINEFHRWTNHERGGCPEQPWEKRNMPNLINSWMLMMKFASFIRSKRQTVYGTCHDFQLDWFYFLLVDLDGSLCFGPLLRKTTWLKAAPKRTSWVFRDVKVADFQQ